MPPVRLALALLAFTACAVDRTTWEPEIEQRGVERMVFRAPTQLPLDILIVVDRSPAMSAYPTVAGEIGQFLAQYATNPDPNWHVGVVSADPRDGGVFRTDGLVGAPFLIDWTQLDKSRSLNYEGPLHTAIARLAYAGSDGSTRTEPLAAITRALSDPRHAGFRRPDAPLVILIATAVDDSSHVDPVEHAAGVQALGRDVFVFLVGGEHTPRLDAWMQVFAHRGQRAPIAREYLAGLLGWPIRASWDAWEPCFDSAPADADPLAAGVQLDCAVEEVHIDGPDAPPAPLRVLPRCDQDPLARPCWRLVEDPINCPAWGVRDHSLAMRIERREYAAPGTFVAAECTSR